MPSINLGTVFTADITQFQSAIANLRAMVSAFNTSLSGIRAGTTTLNQVAQAFQNLSTQTQAASHSVAPLNKQISDLSGTMNRLAGAAKVTASYGLVSSAIFGVVNAMKAGATAAVEYDQSLANLAAISGATKAEMIGMADVMQKTARESLFSTKEVAEGMTLLAQAGFSATETMQAIKGVTDLAVGTLSNLEQTTDLVSTTIRAFGMEAIETTRVVDVMANAINKSKLDVEKLRVAFNYIGAGAKQAGIPLEETAASMMVLADNGMRASTIGTSLRQVISRMIAPSAKLREEFASMGVKIDGLNPKLVGYKQAMENVTKILWDQEKQTVDMAKAYSLFGLRGAQAVAILAQAFREVGPRGFDAYLKSAYAVGSATEMAGIQMEGLVAKLQNLASRFKLVFIAIGEGGASDAIKVLVDALRGLMVVIEDFLKSGTGRFLTALAGWATVFGTATASVLGLGKALSWLGSILMKLTVVQFIVELYKVVQAVGVARAAVWAWQGLLAGAAGPIALVAAAVGTLIAAIRYYNGATDRMIQSTVKIQQASATTAQTLESYITKLQALQKRQVEGADISAEHEMLIKRLTIAYPELADSIKPTTDALNQNIIALKKSNEEALKKAAVASAELIGLYRKQREEMLKWNGVWEVVKGVGTEMLKTAADMVMFYAEKIGKAADWIISKFQDVAKGTGSWVDWTNPVFLLAKGVEALGNAWGYLAEKARAFAKDTQEVKDSIKNENDQILQLAKSLDKLAQGKASLQDIVAAMEQMAGVKLNPEQLELVANAIKKIDTTLQDAKDKWRATLEGIPSVFQDMFKDLGPRAQVAFAAAMKQMDTAVSSYTKKAAELGQTEQQMAQARAAIQAESLTKFVANLTKENMSKEESLKYQYDILVKYEDMMQKKREQTLLKMAEGFDNAMEAAKNEEEAAQVRDQYRQLYEEKEQVFTDTLAGIREARNQVLLQLENAHAAEVKKVHEQLLNDLIAKAEERYKKNQEIVKGVSKSLKEMAKEDINTRKALNAPDPSLKKKKDEYGDFMREKSLIDETVSQARIATDYKEKQALYQQAKQSTKDLIGVVHDQNGQIQLSYQDTQVIAKATFDNIDREATGALQNMADSAVKENKLLEDSINGLREQLQEVKQAKDAISQEPLKLQTDEAQKEMQETYTIVSKFKELWDNIKSKTIDLNVNYNLPSGIDMGGIGGGGGGGGDYGGDEDQGGHTVGQLEPVGNVEFQEGGLVMAMKKGGVIDKFVRRLRDASNVVRAQTGKWIRRPHGKLPGYGGGDRVKVLAEDGEFFVNKVATKKYRKELEAINSMRFPKVDTTAVARSVGGIIGSLKEDIRMARGGPVPSVSYATAGASSRSMVIKPRIIIAPTYMSGDRASARRLATDLTRELDALARQNGRR
jgi:TP901 family phage tail tape measure protein